MVFDDDDDDPNDPRHPDHDLSTAAEYDFDDYSAPNRGPWFMRRWVLIIVAVIVIVGLLAPILR